MMRTMAWFLFLDESGQDRREAPYEVLAGMAIRDRDQWSLVKDLHDAEERRFGQRYSAGTRELKASKILKRKTFQHASLNVDVAPNDVPKLAGEILSDGAGNCSVKHMRALALAKLAYSRDVFELCKRYGCKVFASVVEVTAPPTSSGGLRKDYAYLFERFYYFLEDSAALSSDAPRGILVFDELEKSQSHLLIDQAHRYFQGHRHGPSEIYANCSGAILCSQ